MVTIKIKLSELRKIKGIGNKTLKRIKKHINYKKDLKEERDVQLQVYKLQTNIIHNMDNIKGLRQLIPDNSIDLTITSPPYDNLRDYEQYDFNFKDLAKELYRVTKDGGAAVWIVNDATIDGSETGTSFKQALYFKEIGFNLHDTMIWNKGSFSAVGSLKSRYAPVFEYMFILSKGNLKTFNPIKDRKNKSYGRKITGTNVTSGRESRKVSGYGKKIKKFGQRFNVWKQPPEMNRNIKHPAPFPEDLIKDHIKSWTNKDDVVLDPFMGSGTTAKMAKKLNRKYVGFEISKNYCDIAKERIGD